MLYRELEIIKQAIINEIEGFEFYRMAARQANNKETEEAFLALADEELLHSQYLKQLFNNIKEPGDEVKLAFLSNPPSPNIYNWTKLNKELTSLAMAVFGIGIQMEKDSIKFYEDAKNNTQNEEAKKLYEILIDWEKVHLEQFTQQYNLYKEEWWNEQGFSPF